MHTFASSEPLPAAEGGPSNVVRSGDTIRRARQPWTGAVQALLRHLEEVGFTGSPSAAVPGWMPASCGPAITARGA